MPARCFLSRTGALWLALFVFLSDLIAQCLAEPYNISIATDSPQLVYTPFICNSSTVITNPQCIGAWQVNTSTGTPIVSTYGPDPETANIIPQVFLRVRASALYLQTPVGISNATANVTVSVNNLTVEASFDSALGILAVFNLPPLDVTTFSLSFISSETPSCLAIRSINITVDDDISTSTGSILPTVTLPPSITVPTFIPSSPSTSASAAPSSSSSPPTAQTSPKHRSIVPEAVGLVLGLGLGLTLVATLGFYSWRRRKRRRIDLQINPPDGLRRPRGVSQAAWF